MSTAATPSTAPRMKVALITGAAQGIGAALALRLAQDGYDIGLADLPTKEAELADVAKRVEARGRRVSIIHVDVAHEDQVKAMVEKCVEALGGLDVMIANAGVSGSGTVVNTPVEVWDRTFSINARGVFLSYKHAAAQMIKQGEGGRIIGACSASGKLGAPFLTSYSASKFAMRGLTQVAAQELAPHKITVNCYAPTFVDTPMVARPEDAALGGRGEYVRALFPQLKDVPVLSTDVVAELVSYLVKPEAFIVTGECISLNGTAFFD